METYAEIFGGMAASCSIPVLVLPEVMEGFEEELEGAQSSGLNYLEIFGVLDAGTFSLSYEKLFSMEELKEEDKEDDRFFEKTDVGQVETGSSGLPVEVPVGHIKFSKVNPISSSFHSNFDTQHNVSGRTSQQSIVDEAKNTICVSRPQDNCGPDFKAETTSHSGFVENDGSRIVSSDDHILSGCMEDRREVVGQRKIVNRCFVGATVDNSENDKDAHMSPSKGETCDLKQHSTSSGDISFSDYAFLTISDINLRTQPLEVPPPLRAPPKLDWEGMHKSEVIDASNISFNKSYHVHHVGGPRTHHTLKEVVKSASPIYSNMEVDASKAAAAMIEAMEQAQASLKSAKEFMERTQDSPQSNRRLSPHDFGFWTEQNIIFSGDSRHNIKLEDRLDACQCFPEKESCGMQGGRFIHGCDDVENMNKVEMQNTFSINENKMFPGGEFQLEDGNAKKLKSVIIDKEEVMNIFETSSIDDEDKEKMVRALKFPDEDIEKLVDPISLIQQDRIENELNYRTSSSCEEENGDANSEECHFGLRNQTKKETYAGCNDGKDSEFGGIVNTSEKENRSFSRIDETSEPVKKQRAKWNIPNRSELNVAKQFIRPVYLEMAEDESEFKKGNIMSPFVDTFGSSWKQMDKSIHHEWRDANNMSKEILDGKRKQEAEQKREVVEKERVREREKYMIAVEKVTRDACERVFAEAWERSENIFSDWVAAEARHRPLTVYQDIIENSSAEAFERSEKVANEAKLPARRPAVERATAEARERAIERGHAEEASHEARMEGETSSNCHKDKNGKHNEAEDIVRLGSEDSDKNPRPTFDVIDAPTAMKSQSEGCEGESPLRCKARQERCQRIVERAAKALAEKNMRDLLAQREHAERNRLAETLDAEVRRWSSGKEGNLRALLSTLQYILGHDSGWQPIPLTEVITAAAVRKAYRKATLYVHPDKLQQRGATIQNKYICEKVFDLLKDAWIKFNSEGR